MFWKRPNWSETYISFIHRESKIQEIKQTIIQKPRIEYWKLKIRYLPESSFLKIPLEFTINFHEFHVFTINHFKTYMMFKI